jgi:hypothetical protein
MSYVTDLMSDGRGEKVLLLALKIEWMPVDPFNIITRLRYC